MLQVREDARTGGEARSSLASGLLCALISGGAVCTPGGKAQIHFSRTQKINFPEEALRLVENEVHHSQLMEDKVVCSETQHDTETTLSLDTKVI